MKLALQLALVTGALVVGGAAHAAARAWTTAPGLAVGLAVAGVVLGVALVALLLSSRAEDRDQPTTLIVVACVVVLASAAEHLPGGGTPGFRVGLATLAVASGAAARIALRPGGHVSESWSTRQLVEAALRSERAFETVSQLLPGRADALSYLLPAVTSTERLPIPRARDESRARLVRLLASAGRTAQGDERQRVVEALAKVLARDDDERVLAASAAAARALANPDLIPPLRDVQRRFPTAGGHALASTLLEARAACGDLDVIDDLLAATDADAARDVARALGAAIVPAVSGRLGHASDDQAAGLLSLLGATRSSEAFEVAASRASADTPAKVRAAALRALGDIDPRRAAPLARAAADADDLMVRTWAQSVLRAAGEGA